MVSMPREDEARRLVASRKKSPDSIERCEVVRLWLHVQCTSTTSHLSSGFALGDLSVSCLSLRTNIINPSRLLRFLFLFWYPFIYIYLTKDLCKMFYCALPTISTCIHVRTPADISYKPTAYRRFYFLVILS